jgi:6-phospho-beta-glucosidase
MRFTVVGAGSTYTPELVEGLASRQELLPIDELVLHDVDAARLEIVAGLARRMLARLGSSAVVRATTSLTEAVDGASFVVIQLRVGQQAARLLDESVPDQFGLVGQETTGAGGFAKALRTVPVVRSIADEVRRLAEPDAWILVFTNPVGIITRALVEDGHRVLGLCNVAITFQRLFARLLGTQPEQVELGHAGLNHLTWIRSVCIDGHERLGELLDSPLRELVAGEIGLGPESLDVLKAVPSYYLKYFYSTAAMVRSQRENPRAEEVVDIERRLLAMYADPTLDRKPALLEQRGGAFYSEAAAALVTSLYTDDQALHYVNIRNDGTLHGLPDDAVVEVPARVGRQGAMAERVPDLAPEMLSLVQTVTAYETLTLGAARMGDRDLARRALAAHPLVRDPSVAVPLLDALLEVNRSHLPAFFRD